MFICIEIKLTLMKKIELNLFRTLFKSNSEISELFSDLPEV